VELSVYYWYIIGLLWVYYRYIIGLLSVYYGYIIGLLWVYYRYIIGLLSVYYGYIIGLLSVYYRYIIGLLLVYYRNFKWLSLRSKMAMPDLHWYPSKFCLMKYEHLEHILYMRSSVNWETLYFQHLKGLKNYPDFRV